MFKIVFVRVSLALAGLSLWVGAEMLNSMQPTFAAVAAPSHEALMPIKVVINAFPGMRDYSREEHACLTKVIFVEARGESDEGQKLVAYVAMLRAKRGLKAEGGSTICGVINKKTVRTKEVVVDGNVVKQTVVRRQFSGVKPKVERKTPSNKVDARALAKKKEQDARAQIRAWFNALEVLEGRFVPQGDLRYATHYIEPNAASVEGRCWFKRTLVPIDWVGNHLFYREPTGEEKNILKSVESSPECAEKQLVASR